MINADLVGHDAPIGYVFGPGSDVVLKAPGNTYYLGQSRLLGYYSR